MAAQTKGAASAVPTRWRRFLAGVEPWYDWGIIEVERMQGMTREYSVPGPVRYFDLQWFGLHLSFQIGRTPKDGR
jgi:hypothetical protein